MDIKKMTYEEYYYRFGIFDFEKALVLIHKRKEEHLSNAKINHEEVIKYTEDLVRLVQRIVNRELKNSNKFISLRDAAIICNSKIALLDKNTNANYQEIPNLLGVVSRWSVFISNWYNTLILSAPFACFIFSITVGITSKNMFLFLLSFFSLLFLSAFFIAMRGNIRKDFMEDKSKRYINRNLYYVQKECKPYDSVIVKIAKEIRKWLPW